MPTYSYHCDTGDHDFEIVQRFSDDALTVCPECGGSVRRVIQPVGVVFKGSGWYINDSRKSSSEGSSSSVKEKSSEKSDASSSKTPDKPKEGSSSSSSPTSSEKSPAKAAS
ncbi:MAG: zinc ribbon domain-containing protein [Thermomicrobiales bacterium]|nr:zinc ribbon domain-containing protein [Thermomicrobiales bacterium]